MPDEHGYRPIPGLESWGFLETKEGESLKDLPWLSDRAAGIVATALLENRLDAIVRENFVQDDARLMQQLFQEQGPLGTLSAKIQISYALGLVTAQGRRDLDCIRKIRNSFAHDLTTSTFEAESIKARCFNIKVVEEMVGEIPTIPPSERPLVEKRNAQLLFVGAESALTDARARFFLAVNCFVYATLGPRSARDRSRPFVSPYF